MSVALFINSVRAAVRRLALTNRVRLGEQKQSDSAYGRLCSMRALVHVTLVEL